MLYKGNNSEKQPINVQKAYYVLGTILDAVDNIELNDIYSFQSFLYNWSK